MILKHCSLVQLKSVHERGPCRPQPCHLLRKMCPRIWTKLHFSLFKRGRVVATAQEHASVITLQLLGLLSLVISYVMIRRHDKTCLANELNLPNFDPCKQVK